MLIIRTIRRTVLSQLPQQRHSVDCLIAVDQTTSSVEHAWMEQTRESISGWTSFLLNSLSGLPWSSDRPNHVIATFCQYCRNVRKRTVGNPTGIHMEVHWMPTFNANCAVSFSCLKAGVRKQCSLIKRTVAIESIATRTETRHFIDTDVQYDQRPIPNTRRRT